MQQQQPAGTATLSVTRGNPTAEELAAVTALLTTLGSAATAASQEQEPAERVARIRKRRALSVPRLPWTIARR